MLERHRRFPCAPECLPPNFWKCWEKIREKILESLRETAHIPALVVVLVEEDFVTSQRRSWSSHRRWIREGSRGRIGDSFHSGRLPLARGGIQELVRLLARCLHEAEGVECLAGFETDAEGLINQ